MLQNKINGYYVKFQKKYMFHGDFINFLFYLLFARPEPTYFVEQLELIMVGWISLLCLMCIDMLEINVLDKCRLIISRALRQRFFNGLKNRTVK